MSSLQVLPTALGQLGQVRQPRGIVQINGTTVPGWIEMEVDTNAFRESDTFRVTFGLSFLQAPYNAAWFASQSTITISLYAGFPSDPSNYSITDLDLLLVGNVDEVGLNPAQRTLALSGRDLTALLIDSKTAENWNNQTSSQIITTLATRHGLTPVVTATPTLSGKFFAIDHRVATVAQTEWDLACWLAQQEGFVVYVKGHELHFEPPPNSSSAPQYPLQWKEPTDTQGFQSNTSDLSFHRTLTVGKTITVQVRSFNQKQRAGFTVSYPSTHGTTIRPGQATSPAQLYSYRIPNLTLAQAQQRAQALYNELIQNEMRLTARLPADNVLDTLHVMPVTGTNTVFDQTYYPLSITRRLSFTEGYVMDVEARNHSEALQPVEQLT